jgi:hypothetical protein
VEINKLAGRTDRRHHGKNIRPATKNRGFRTDTIYSKSQDAIISYEDSEDKDDPTIKENCDEEVDMLFSKFVEAKPVQVQ